MAILRLRNTDLEGVESSGPSSGLRAEKIIEKRSIKAGIETYRAGLPGQERLMANAKNGDQLGVRPFEGAAVLDIERMLIRQSEGEAQEKMKEHDDVEVKGEIAKQAIEETADHTEDLSKLIRSLEEKKNSLLLVDPDTIKNPSVPREGLQLLVKEEEGNDLRSSLENFGYHIEDIDGGAGMVAKKGDSEFVFQYASERPAAASLEKDGIEEKFEEREMIEESPALKRQQDEDKQSQKMKKPENEVVREKEEELKGKRRVVEEDVEGETEELPSLEELQERAEEQGGFVLYVEGMPDIASLDGGGEDGIYLADGSSLEQVKKDAGLRGGKIYGFRMRGDAKIADVVDKSVKDFTPAERKKFAQKYDLIRFEDEEGRTEYVLLRKNAVEETGGGAE